MKKIIGTITTYCSEQQARNAKVRIAAVIKVRLGREAYLYDDEVIAFLNGVEAGDRVEVQPWLEELQRFSFNTEEALATELEYFRELRKNWN